MPKVGENLIITLQLYDGLASMPKRVFVDLSAPNGTLLFPRFEILHVINGDFRDTTHVMPDLNYVTAQYFVYEPNGITLDDDYIINKDVFMKEDVEGVVTNNQPISGIISSNSLSGELDSLQIDGTLDNELEIVGEVLDEC